jgi:hypothetical protein
VFTDIPTNLVWQSDTASDTDGVKATIATPATPDPDSDWQKSPYANLIRYKTSDTYFARVRIKGKLIRRTLKTKSI